MRPDPVERLLNVLRSERTALLAGDFATLDMLLAKKEKYLSAVLPERSGGAVNDARWTELRDACQQNQALLAAALRGLAQARDTLRAISAPPATCAYGPDGTRSEVGTTRAKVLRSL